jgi:hypothetical protein
MTGDSCQRRRAAAAARARCSWLSVAVDMVNSRCARAAGAGEVGGCLHCIRQERPARCCTLGLVAAPRAAHLSFTADPAAAR